MRSQAVNTFTNRSNHKCQALVWDFKAPATERNFQVSIFFSSSSIKTYSEHGSNQLMVARMWFSVIQSSHSPTKCRDDEWDVQSAKQLGDLPTLSSQDNEVSQDQPMQTQKCTFPQSSCPFAPGGDRRSPPFALEGKVPRGARPRGTRCRHRRAAGSTPGWTGVALPWGRWWPHAGIFQTAALHSPVWNRNTHPHKED